MYAIIIYSTDMRSPNYRIEFTQSESKARKAANTEATYTYEDPEEARNYHHDLVVAYKLPDGWRKPSKAFIDKEVLRLSGSIYSPNANGVIYSSIVKDGTMLEDCD